jgi:hypothetical protein
VNTRTTPACKIDIVSGNELRLLGDSVSSIAWLACNYHNPNGSGCTDPIHRVLSAVGVTILNPSVLWFSLIGSRKRIDM